MRSSMLFRTFKICICCYVSKDDRAENKMCKKLDYWSRKSKSSKQNYDMMSSMLFSDFFPYCGLSPPFNVVCYVERCRCCHHKAQESLQIENRRDLFDVGGTKSMKRKKIKAKRASIVGFACLLCFFWTSNPIFCTSYSQL